MYYFQIIAKQRKMIVGITLAAAVISIIYSICLPNIYSAKAMLYPVQEDKNLMPALMGQLGGLAGLAGGSLGGPTQTDLYVSMLKCEDVKDAIIDRFKLMDIYKTKYRSDAYQKLDKRSSFIAGKKDGIITITIDDKNPKLAANLANAYMDELGKFAVNVSVAGAGRSKEFFEERLQKAKDDLVRAENSLRQFQAENKTIDIKEQAKASIEGIAKLKAELAVQEVKLATLRRQFTDSSQEVKTVATMVSSLREQVAGLEGNGRGGAIPSVGSIAGLGQDYVRLMREFKIQEALVEGLTKQFEMAQLNEAKTIPSFQIIQKARVPERKSKPHRLLIVLAVTFYSFVLSTLTAIITARFNLRFNKTC
jgi:capsule polysaccharide export protein KpsE/RkpR